MFNRAILLEPGFERRGRWLEVSEPGALSAIRAARLCAEHSLKLKPTTVSALNAIDNGSPEHQRHDLERLLLTNQAAYGLHLLDQMGWFARYLPELEACKDVEPFGFHHLNVFEHSLEALRVLTELFGQASLETRLATVLHDIGKPASRVWDEVRGRWSFFGHDDAGAELSRLALTRFGFPAGLIERVGLLIARHMIRLPGDEAQAARFVRRQRALLPDLLEVMLCDREAARGASSSLEARLGYQLGFERVLEAMRAHDSPRPLLSGAEVMAALGLSPGPEVGMALRFISQLRTSGEITTTEEAKAALLAWHKARQ